MLLPEHLERLPELIHFRDPDFRIVWATLHARQTFGWDVLPRQATRHLDMIEEGAAYAREHGTWAGVMAFPDALGVEKRYMSRWSTLWTEAGELHGYFVLEQDMATVQFTDSNLVRSQRMESLATLAGGVAHDMNNVLGPILMGAEMIRRRVQDPWAQQKLKEIEASARRGADIIRQILDFSRGTEGEKIPVQIRHVLKELVQFGAHAFPKSIDVAGTFPRDLPTIIGDAGQIRQAVLNLMVNAGDAMPDGGTMTLEAEPVSLLAEEADALSPHGTAGHYVQIRVRDTGSGIAPEVVARVFEPFYTTKARGRGTGLGLATTLSIVQGHEGFMSVESEPGRGSTFSLFFPMAELPQTETVGQQTSSVTLAGQGQTILVVDDEPMMLEMNADMLEAFGYETLKAVNGKEGLKQFEAAADRISMVITDINMPVMNGPAMIEAIHALKPDLPVIAISGLSGTVHSQEGTALGGVQILHKPYAIDDLLHIVEQKLGGSQETDRAEQNDRKADRPHTGDTLSDNEFDDLMGGDW